MYRPRDAEHTVLHQVIREQLGLDMRRFGACIEGNPYAADVDRDMAQGMRSGVTRTPKALLGAR